jgi:hypothetical protein
MRIALPLLRPLVLLAVLPLAALACIVALGLGGEVSPPAAPTAADPVGVSSVARSARAVSQAGDGSAASTR